MNYEKNKYFIQEKESVKESKDPFKMCQSDSREINLKNNSCKIKKHKFKNHDKIFKSESIANQSNIKKFRNELNPIKRDFKVFPEILESKEFSKLNILSMTQEANEKKSLYKLKEEKDYFKRKQMKNLSKTRSQELKTIPRKFKLKYEREIMIKEKIVNTIRKRLEEIDLSKAIQQENVLNFKLEIEEKNEVKKKELLVPTKMKQFYENQIDSKFELLENFINQRQSLNEEIRSIKSTINTEYNELNLIKQNKSFRGWNKDFYFEREQFKSNKSKYLDHNIINQNYLNSNVLKDNINSEFFNKNLLEKRSHFHPCFKKVNQKKNDNINKKSKKD